MGKLLTPNGWKFGHKTIIIAACLFLLASTGVVDGDQNQLNAGNPYLSIVTRNVFGLVSALPSETRVETGRNLPRITPNGVMTIFGRPQALFKTITGDDRPGWPAKEESYLLAEGETKDDIEVRHIDVNAAVVTFNNHGTIEVIPLIPPANNPLALLNRFRR
jgi:hypothetical protein